METQEPIAVARSTDPETSHAAAASVTGIRPRQQAVLDAFRKCGPMAHEELLYRYRLLKYMPQSDSGLRTRCSELVALGKLIDTGQRTHTRSGRRTIIWGIPEPPLIPPNLSQPDLF